MTAGNLNTVGEERRVSLELRVIFVEAYEIIRPLFDKTSNWGGLPLDHLAFRALQEHFPALSSDQAFVIVCASKRMHDSGDFPAP